MRPDVMPLLDCLRENGLGNLVDVLLTEEDVYDYNGRFQPGVLCAKLNIDRKEMGRIMEKARMILESDNGAFVQR